MLLYKSIAKINFCFLWTFFYIFIQNFGYIRKLHFQTTLTDFTNNLTQRGIMGNFILCIKHRKICHTFCTLYYRPSIYFLVVSNILSNVEFVQRHKNYIVRAISQRLLIQSGTYVWIPMSTTLFVALVVAIWTEKNHGYQPSKSHQFTFCFLCFQTTLTNLTFRVIMSNFKYFIILTHIW